ncbi:hypothetical protein D3C86_1934670 [compost metagenome]
MEIAPAWVAEQVVNDHRSITLTGKALIAGQLFSSLIGFVTVVVRVEEFHECLR